MAFRSRRTVYYLALVFALLVAFTAAYNLGMAVWENEPQPLYRSLEVVVQSFTTTGYGQDAPWQTLPMNLLVIGMQLSGIAIVLAAVNVFAVPWLRNTLSPAPPKSVSDVADHVVVCGDTPRTEVLMTELHARDRECVLVDPDDDVVVDRYREGYRVVHGAPESTDVLENAGVADAAAVVADAADDTNASIALSVREVDADVPVVSLVEDASLERYHEIAGADTVLSPRQLVGKSLAQEVPAAVTTTGDGIEIGDEFEFAELSVEEGSDLCDTRFAEARLHPRFGVNAIGIWYDGTFETPIDPHDRLEEGTRLLVAGESDRLDDLREATAATVSEIVPREIVVAGYGETGAAAHETLATATSRLTVLDVDDGDHVDVVGDARDADAMREAGIEEASILILTVGDDTVAIFATLIARDLNPDLKILVRANEDDNVQQLYRAGADYVQSLATVSGRMLVSTVLEGEDVLAYDKRVSVVRLSAPGLEGRTVVDANVRTETGCTVLAVVRDGETIPDFDPSEFTVTADDEVVIAGTDDDITEFERQFGD